MSTPNINSGPNLNLMDKTPKIGEAWTHLNHNITMVNHPKTPEGHQAYNVVNPAGKMTTMFSPSFKRLNDDITMEHRRSLLKHLSELTSLSGKDKSIDDLIFILQKARRRLSDEPSEDGDEQDVSPEEVGMREFNPDEEGDSADDWLKENDPETGNKENSYETQENDEPKENDEQSYGEVKRPIAENEASEEEIDGSQSDPAKTPAQQASPEKVKGASRFSQPTREEIAEMRGYTRPWEQRAREKATLEAQASKNPVLYHQGKMIESRIAHHGNRHKAHEELKNSPDYQSAGKVKRMRMEAEFDKKWHEQNPDHLKTAMEGHGRAHGEGVSARDVHRAAKQEAIEHVIGGGAQPETPMSVEEGLQHAGGTKGEEGTVGTVTQDPASSFASGNRQFLDQYRKNLESKGKKPKDVNEMMDYDEGSKRDVERILGDHPALKNPEKKAKVDAFFQKYHPLIGMNASRVMKKLGLDEKRGDIDLGVLHEAGMHGLMHAINDYNHDHPSKASFVTHVSNKIRGLQQTALREQDKIPQELRTGAKRFQQAKAEPVKQAEAAPATPVPGKPPIKMSQGGIVPGEPNVPGDSVENDTVDAKLSPNELVIPASKTSDAESAKSFVDAQLGKDRLKQLIAQHGPDVADRMKRISTFRSMYKPKAPTGEGNE